MPYSEHSDDQKYEVDVEKAAQHCDITGSTAVILAVDDGVNRESGVFGRMWKVIVWANAFGVEARGIERVPEEERTHEGIYDSGFLWLSASMTVATLRTLGSSIWYMGLTDALLTIVFFNLLTTIPVAIFATWGMRTGLRQMVLVRHHWCLFPRPPQLYCMPRVVRHQYPRGINQIVGASVLPAIPGSDQIPQAAGIVIIAILTLGVALFGYKIVHKFESKTTWKAAYAANGVGGLIGAPLSAMGKFGSLLLVILALSVVANNVPNMYSFSLSFQVFGKYAQAIPRMFLVIIGTAIYIVLALVGYSHFEQWLSTLLTILSYWLAIYSLVLLEEHYVFRGGSFPGYTLEGYNDPSVLPRGWAASIATGVGIAGAVLGMTQTWYIGKLGALIGPPPYGADIGFELSGSFAAVTYPIFRYLEKKYGGR